MISGTMITNLGPFDRVPMAALENEVGIRQCRPKCRPINLLGRQIFADLNLA